MNAFSRGMSVETAIKPTDEKREMEVKRVRAAGLGVGEQTALS